MQSKDHWEKVYETKAVSEVSWFQAHADTSFRLIAGATMCRHADIIDVGGGASTLIDDLLRSGYSNVTVLDLSERALAAAKARIGRQAVNVTWYAGDITKIQLPRHAYDIWHDRAVFHFLTEPKEREAYVRAVLHSVKPGGHVIVGTFAEDGPQQCSGLPVVRYRAEDLHAEFGAPFNFVKHVFEDHHTPLGTVQKFIYCQCQVVQIGSV